MRQILLWNTECEMHNAVHGDENGLFGVAAGVNEQQVANSLFPAAAGWGSSSVAAGNTSRTAGEW